MSNTEKKCLNGQSTPDSNRVTCDSGIQSFSFEGALQVRIIVIDGTPHFVAVDVAKALGYYVPKDAVSQHCRRAVKHRLSDNHGVPHDYNVIPESDVYRLIIRSNLPTAEKFQDWVFEEVLPSIRKTGAYNTPQSARTLTGEYVQITGAEGNLYMFSIFKAFREFVGEEVRGNAFTELRLNKKIEAARTLFHEEAKKLRNNNVKIQ